MLFLVIGLISLVDEIQFMLISSRLICIRSIYCNVFFFSVTVEVKMKSKTGYLSATDWPLLPVSIIIMLIMIQITPKTLDTNSPNHS